MAGGGGNEPNLTPFIDLFSVLVCFLLMTAAWVQLESFQVQVEEKPKLSPDVANETPPPPEEEKPKKAELTLHLRRDRLIARENKVDKASFTVNGMNLATPELASLLGDWRARFPGDKQMIILHSGQKATYGQLIKLYDAVSQSGWTDIAISPYEEPPDEQQQ